MLAKAYHRLGEDMGYRTYLDVGEGLALHSSHASSSVKFDLPHAAEVGEEVLNALARLYVPHFDRLLTAADNLVPIVLKAGDSSSMSRERVLAAASVGIPDPESGIGRS